MSNILRINGLEREFPEGRLPETLADLLNELSICHATVVAEIDGKIVERKDFATTRLAAGQAIELVRFVGGG
ncbi:MAG TPA: sulfur carrier protein ThiS [Anaerohalosphaeraceae bacterium]|nr:sulfur carrier protein ThiS [Anaerohalosphaeraceae bacterium]HRT49787.1 sulfur carrier protein ThiS [Anaerohalosphaeraceae bacterium]HRT85553.1 sulfur carrier protein ThiS [Anaerohalosphaeraceae bacterium]